MMTQFVAFDNSNNQSNYRNQVLYLAKIDSTSKRLQQKTSTRLFTVVFTYTLNQYFSLLYAYNITLFPPHCSSATFNYLCIIRVYK